MISPRILAGACVVASVLSACHRQMPMDDHMAHMAAGDLSAPSKASATSTAQGDMSLPPSNNTAGSRQFICFFASLPSTKVNRWC